eukprot:261405-Prymnesium_polylepis.1
MCARKLTESRYARRSGVAASEKATALRLVCLTRSRCCCVCTCGDCGVDSIMPAVRTSMVVP